MAITAADLEDYSFWSLEILGWEPGKANYPSPLNDNTTTLVFQKPDNSVMLFLLAEFDLTNEIVYTKIEEYKYDVQSGSYVYTGRNRSAGSDIIFALNDIFEEESVRSVAAKLYRESVEYNNIVNNNKGSKLFLSHSRYTVDIKKAMYMRDKHKEAGDTETADLLDHLIFGLLLTYTFPVANEDSDYYVEELAPLDPIDITYKMGSYNGSSGYIIPNVVLHSITIPSDANIDWMYQFFEEDPDIKIYHHDCSNWKHWTRGAEILATGQSGKYLAIAATLKKNLAEGYGIIQLGDLLWLYDLIVTYTYESVSSTTGKLHVNTSIPSGYTAYGWKYKFFVNEPVPYEDVKYHQNCTSWSDWDHTTEIPVTSDLNNKWICVVAVTMGGLAEAIGYTKLTF